MRWSVENLGLGVTRNSVWFDQIYISSEGSLERQARTYSIVVRHDGILSVGSGYSGIATFTVPARVFGVYQIIVETDLYDSVYENVFENNNDFVSMVIVSVVFKNADKSYNLLTYQKLRN